MGVGGVAAELSAFAPAVASPPGICTAVAGLETASVWVLMCIALLLRCALLPLLPRQVALGLYVNLGGQMLLQVEALLGLLLLPLAEGKGAHHGAPLELRQAALEGVLDFCSQPSFARDVYLNLDCR